MGGYTWFWCLVEILVNIKIHILSKYGFFIVPKERLGYKSLKIYSALLRYFLARSPLLKIWVSIHIFPNFLIPSFLVYYKIPSQKGKVIYIYIVPKEGLEPSPLSRLDFESSASTIPPLRQFKKYDSIFFVSYNSYLLVTYFKTRTISYQNISKTTRYPNIFLGAIL
jgi:hypothetical protein